MNTTGMTGMMNRKDVMDIAEFKDVFIDRCKSELGGICPDYMNIEERTVHKAQQGDLTGLCFSSPMSPCAPTIYVEDFYELYRNGHQIGQLSKDAVKTVLCGFDQIRSFPMEEFSDTDDHTKLRVRLINREANISLLSSAPHIDAGDDMALVAYLESGEFRALVTDELMDTMELTEEELFAEAFRIALKYDPPVMHDLSETLFEGPEACRNYLAGHCDPDEHSEDAGSVRPERKETFEGRLFVLSNTDLYWGASALFYPGVMAAIGNILGGPFYVLPSSVHELILLPASEADPANLLTVIRSANRTVVDSRDKLSDDLYICGSEGLQKVVPETEDDDET